MYQKPRILHKIWEAKQVVVQVNMPSTPTADMNAEIKTSAEGAEPEGVQEVAADVKNYT
jgi:hypothetical protein